MPKSVLNGYLTDKCEKCPFWADGTDERGLGCAIPFPIIECPFFRKIFEGGEKDDHEGKASDSQAD